MTERRRGFFPSVDGGVVVLAAVLLATVGSATTLSVDAATHTGGSKGKQPTPTTSGPAVPGPGHSLEKPTTTKVSSKELSNAHTPSSAPYVSQGGIPESAWKGAILEEGSNDIQPQAPDGSLRTLGPGEVVVFDFSQNNLAGSLVTVLGSDGVSAGISLDFFHRKDGVSTVTYQSDTATLGDDKQIGDKAFTVVTSSQHPFDVAVERNP